MRCITAYAILCLATSNLIGQDLAKDGVKDTALSVPHESAFSLTERLNLKGNRGARTVQFSFDGKSIAETRQDGKIVVWDAATGDTKVVIDTDDKGGRKATFDPDGQRLASTNWNEKKVLFWALDTGKKMHALEIEDRPEAIEFDQKGLVYAIGTTAIDQEGAGTVQIRDAISHKLRQKLTAKSRIVAHFAFSPDGKRLAYANYATNVSDVSDVIVCDVTTGNELCKLNGHTSLIHDVRFSPCGKWIATASWDSSARIWNAENGELIHAITRTGLGGKVNSASFSPDGNWLILWHIDGMSIRDVGTGLEVYRKLCRATAVAIDRQCKTLVTAGIGDTFVWEMKLPQTSGQTIPKKQTSPTPITAKGKFRYAGTGFNDVKFSSDGRLLGASNRDGISIWEMPAGKLVHNFPIKGGSYALDFSFDGRFLLGGRTSYSDPCAVWEIATEKVVCDIAFKTTAPTLGRLAFHPQSKFFAVARYGNMVEFRHTETGAVNRQFKAHEGTTRGIAFSPDGKWLAVSDGVLSKKSAAYPDNVIRLWDVDNSKLQRTLKGHEGEPQGISFSPDGKYLASSGLDHTVKIWDVATGDLIRTIWLHSMSSHVAWGPDGTWLAANAHFGDNTVSFRDVATRQELLSLNADATSCMAMNAEGTLLATASNNGLVVWEISRGKAKAAGPFAPGDKKSN